METITLCQAMLVLTNPHASFFYTCVLTFLPVSSFTGYGGGQVPSVPFPKHRSGSWANEPL